MAQNDTTAYSSDPILQYKPAFVQSLPVQIFLIGVVLTLSVVLLLHLLFTAQYHWPLARVNYILQLTGVMTLTASVLATIYVVFSSTINESQHWPYMLSYLAVSMPNHNVNTTNTNDPTVLYAHRWSFAESATWTVMNATTSMVIQITHIHFLTLLYPSNLEARLIFSLLGPLAIISAIMQLLPIVYGTEVQPLAEDTRNVCNAALSLLFTSALIIWGFFVNREAAWRTDGGTAAFGAGAILLALISTTLNFVYIPSQDQYSWMPKLMWSVVMWQSFLGWWWWVGAGMGVGEVEEMLKKEEKRDRKRKLKAQRRKAQREKARTMWKGVTGAFRTKRESDDTGESSEGREGVDRTFSKNTPASANIPSASDSTIGSSRAILPLHFVNHWYARLRHAHLTAARIQAVERVERIYQVYGHEGTRNSLRDPGTQVVGWGLGSYGLRGVERGVERDRREEQDPQIIVETDQDKDPDNNTTLDLPPRNQSFRRRGYYPESQPSQQAPPALEEEIGWTSLWWWGPLRRWRLRDSTAYK